MVSCEVGARANVQCDGFQKAQSLALRPAKCPRVLRFLRIALNSTSELEYHLLAARDLKVVHASDTLTLITQVIEVRKMLYGLLRYLASRTEDRGGVPAKAMTQA